jgi:CheY-like chemotaxis protein
MILRNMIEEMITILYIDDDTDDLLVFGESIQTLCSKATVLKAESGEDGLEILSTMEKELKSFPCLIILDMNMPRMDGKQTLKAIRSRKAWDIIPVVIFTTSTNTADIEFCKNYGADYMTKPMDYKSLNSAIKQLLSYCNVRLD